MADDRLRTDLIVNAQIRTAAAEGVPIVVIRKGDLAGGTILLKINRLDGHAHLLTQVRIGDELVWSPLTKTDPLPEKEADSAMRQQASYDPDLWLIEIEDKQGRHWFPGKRAGR
ncbi:MAG: DUF1491 family protein [Alphaproteobacteria bacterium]|nr:DUF1491 family protein [Alphaproteobacteria bacterium]